MKKGKQSPTKKKKARTGRSRLPRVPTAIIVVGGLVLFAVIVFSFSQTGAQNIQPVRVGAELGNFWLNDISGERVEFSDYEGDVVLINTWAIWCPPCRAEMPALNAYYQEHTADGFTILAVNAGESAADAATFAQDYSLSFPVLLDPQTQLLSRLNIHSFPTSILIGRDGKVKDIHIGMLTPEQIEAKISPLLTQ